MADLSRAVDVLCHASIEELREIEFTKLEKLSQRLRVAHPLQRDSDKLATALGKKGPELEKFFAQAPENAVGTPPAARWEYRILDILVASGSGENTLQAMFRRALAEWSLAAAYSAWDKGSRLIAISTQRTFRPTKKPRQLSVDNFIRKFFMEKDASTVRSGVAAGLRYHAMDKAYPGCGILLGFVHHHALHANFLDISAALGSPELLKVIALGKSKRPWMVEVWRCYRPEDCRAATLCKSVDFRLEH